IMYLKRFFVFMFVSATAAFCFSGCYAITSDIHSSQSNVNVEIQPYDEDDINNANALSLIKSYTPEELGLSGSIDDYTFLVSSEKAVIDDESYCKIVAGIVNESGKNDIYNIEEINHYLVSNAFDKILVYDKETNHYNALENVRKIPNMIQ
ncbi:MAG: hypothetical protein K2G22_02620, partial [Eubacterium sp.]|nr:hypothetical protein [Eubacterium sp.]